MKSEYEIKNFMDTYADTIRRICFLHLKNEHDYEDIFQECILKWMKQESFENAEHEKAWVIRVTINACKDLLKSFFHKNTIPLEAIQEVLPSASPEQSYLLQDVLALPTKYRQAIYLHYYEGYPAKEIASILGCTENNVYSLLSRGRQQLKQELGGEDRESNPENISIHPRHSGK